MAVEQRSPDPFGEKWNEWHKGIFLRDLEIRPTQIVPVEQQVVAVQTTEPNPNPITVREKRAAELFLTGYLEDAFATEDLPDGKIRISSKSKDASKREVFKSILSHWGRVVAFGTYARFDTPRLDFLKISQEEREAILSDKEDFASYFIGIWAAKEFMARLTLKSEESQRPIIIAGNKHFSEGNMRLGSKNSNRIRAIVIADPQALQNGLLATKSVQMLPFGSNLPFRSY